MNFIYIFSTFLIWFSPFVLGQRTFLDSDENIQLYRAFKELALTVFGDRTNNNHQKGRSLEKLQRRISNEVPFPCNVTGMRSKIVPKSVNELRPGDIDVIGALGDSIIAGTGILATNLLQLTLENRGVSALGGGQGTWRDYFTIPNIIKEFNPNLIGYAPYDSLTHQTASGFNVAEIAAMSRDLPYMAENLVGRIKNHPKVDLKNHWKLISILMGANDFCSDMCYASGGPWSILKNHKNDLINALRIFKENLPRTLILLIPPPNVKHVSELPDKPISCSLMSKVECSCFVGLRWLSQRDEFNKIISGWYKIDEEVASYPEFHTEEFAVVVQPFTTNMTFPIKSDGSVDWTYLSVDCFHLSQSGHARGSTWVSIGQFLQCEQQLTSPSISHNFPPHSLRALHRETAETVSVKSVSVVLHGLGANLPFIENVKIGLRL